MILVEVLLDSQLAALSRLSTYNISIVAVAGVRAAVLLLARDCRLITRDCDNLSLLNCLTLSDPHSKRIEENKMTGGCALLCRLITYCRGHHALSRISGLAFVAFRRNSRRASPVDKLTCRLITCRLTTYRHRFARVTPAPRAKRNDSKNRGRASPVNAVLLSQHSPVARALSGAFASRVRPKLAQGYTCLANCRTTRASPEARCSGWKN